MKIRDLIEALEIALNAADDDAISIVAKEGDYALGIADAGVYWRFDTLEQLCAWIDGEADAVSRVYRVICRCVSTPVHLVRASSPEEARRLVEEGRAEETVSEEVEEETVQYVELDRHE